MRNRRHSPLVNQSNMSRSGRWQRVGRTTIGVALVLALLPACREQSGRATSGRATTTLTSEASQQVVIAPPGPSVGPATTASSSGTSTASTGRSFPRPAGEVPRPCGISTGLLAPNDPSPGAPASDIAAFSFPPPEAAAEERPVTEEDIRGFMTVFRAVRNLAAETNFVVIDGSARAARIPSNGQNWGMASFALAPGETRMAPGFDPPDNRLVFVQPPGCPWTAIGQVLASAFPCSNFQDLPVGVQKAWGLSSPSDEECADAFYENVAR